MTKPLYFYNGTTFELVGPTTPQSPIAYQTSAPTAPATGDLWIDSDGDVDTYNRQLTRYYFVATAAQTTITGIDANGLTLAYVAGSEAVYVNGALQVRGQDYTATNGTSVVMTSALAVNDVVEIFAYTAFTVANAYTKSETDGLVGAAAGLKLLTPTSIAVGSGSGSANAAGYVTFSGASSVSLNNVFSSTYDSYKVIITLTAASTAANLQPRFRASGTDSSASYYNAHSYIVSGSGTLTVQQDANISSMNMGDYSSTSQSIFVVDIFNVFAAAVTAFNYQVGMSYSTASRSFVGSGMHNVSTSYDGITIRPSSGTITGTVAVYGYKD